MLSPSSLLTPPRSLDLGAIALISRGYYARMAQRGRLILGTSVGVPVALCTFFVLQSPLEVDRYHRRGIWTTPLDEASGPLIYVDKLICVHWSREVLRRLEHLIVTQVPAAQRAVWFRPGQDLDRWYTYRRRYNPYGPDI